MQFDIFNKKKVAQLQSELFDTQRALFESQQFERIASEKLKMWVNKHDTLLASYKLIKNKMENENKVTDAEIVEDVKAEVTAEEKVAEDVAVQSAPVEPVAVEPTDVEAEPVVEPVAEVTPE